MAYVNVLDVQVLDNPTVFTNPFQFEITFECLKELKDGPLMCSACVRLADRGPLCVCARV